MATTNGSLMATDPNPAGVLPLPTVFRNLRECRPVYEADDWMALAAYLDAYPDVGLGNLAIFARGRLAPPASPGAKLRWPADSTSA